MNELMNVSEVQTMSSREIAELTGKNHADVCRDVRVLLCSLYGGLQEDYIRKADLLYHTNQGVACVQYNPDNPNAWEYLLDKDHTICLVSGYKAQYTAWRPLKKYCQEHKLEIKKTWDDRYGSVNLYPREAWEEIYPYINLPDECAVLLGEAKDEP